MRSLQELTLPSRKQTATQKRKKKNRWNGYCTSWYTRQGLVKAVCHNIRKVLPKAYYEQLEDQLMRYKEVTILDYFNHLDEIWYKMNTKTVKKMTAEFYEPWIKNMHIAKFEKHLDERQEYLTNTGIKITDVVKLQLYLE